MIVRALLPSLLLSTSLLVTACARSEDAAVVADSNELQPVERVRTPEQDDEEIAIGSWTDSLQEQDSALEFGPQGAAPLFSFRCDARRSILLQRHGVTATGDLPMMLVTIGSETRRLAVTGAGGTVPMLRASLAPSDPLVETLASAATPIIIRIGDAPPLALPPAPSIKVFVDRCSSGSAAPAAGERNEAQPAPASEPANEAEAQTNAN